VKEYHPTHIYALAEVGDIFSGTQERSFSAKEIKIREYEVPRYIEFVEQLPLLPGTKK